MKLDIYISVEEKDLHGQLKYFSRKRANSLVMNFIDFLAVQMGQQAVSMTDTAGSPQSNNISASNMRCDAGANTATYGIRVGTGTGAVAVTDTALGTFIAHGTGAGQLSHGANSIGSPVTSGTSRQFTVSRTFTNNTASGITVNEIGLIGRGINATFYFLIDRTLNTFTINAGTSKTVTYTIKVTV